MFEQLSAFVTRRVTMQPLRDFFSLLFAASPSTFDILLSVVGTLFAVLGGMAFPILGLLYGRLLDNMNQTCDNGVAADEALVASARRKTLGILGIAAANFVVIYGYNACWGLFAERLTYRLRSAYLRALLKQEPAFFAELPAGEIATRLDADTVAIQIGTGDKVAHYITSLSYVFAAYAVGFSQDANLTFKMCVLIPVYFVWSTLCAKYLHRFSTVANKGISSGTDLAAECLRSIPLVHAFNASGYFEKQFRMRLEDVRSAETGKVYTLAAQGAFLYLIEAISSALAIWQGSKQIAEPDSVTTFGQVFTIIAVLLDATLVFAHVSHYLAFFVAASASYKNLLPVLHRESRIDATDLDSGSVPESVRGKIELKRLSFRYPTRPENLVLDDVSFSIPAGKTTAIVGRSGSGKSTIAALLNRLFDPEAGQIVIDGQDVCEWNIQRLRRCIAVVEQEPVLMNRSVLENVAYGLAGCLEPWRKWQPGELEGLAERLREGQTWQTATRESPILAAVTQRVETALRQAHALDFVSRLQYGMATVVGPHGSQLSGGQRQRIAIARGLVRKAPIIVFDEGTSALDTETERAIQQTLLSEFADSTIVLIAHRLSTIKSAHHVIILDNGSIVQEGSYEDVMSDANKVLARLVQLQEVLEAPADTSSKSSEFEAPSKDVVLDGSTSDISEPHWKRQPNTNPEDAKADAPVTLTSEKQGYFKLLGHLQEYTRAYRHLLAVGLLMAIFMGISYSINALLRGSAVASLSTCNPPDAIRSSGGRLAAYYLVIGIITFTAYTTSAAALGQVADRLLRSLRVLSLRSLLAQGMGWHESEQRTPARLLGYLSGDTVTLSTVTGSILGLSLAAMVSLAASTLLALVIAWRVAILLVVTAPLSVASGFWRMRSLSKFQERHQEAFHASVDVASEAVSAIHTVASFGLEVEMLETYQCALKKPYDATLRLIGLGDLLLALGYSVPIVTTGLCYWWGGKQVLAGTYSAAQLFSVLPAMTAAAAACGQLFRSLSDLSRASIAGKRVFDLVDLLPQKTQKSAEADYDSDLPSDDEADMETVRLLPLGSRKDDSSAPRSSYSDGGVAVELRNVTFAYPSRPETFALRDLSIDIPAGMFCAFVGPSGAGKSTIFSMIERFYRPSSGSVIVDGQVISKSDDLSFRESIALVPQTNMVFSGSVAFNMQMGALSNSAGPSEIEDAARLANIHDTISTLPQGYETACGVGGRDFSGGQLQRISLARALLRKPQLLLLDEPTSALDSESEAEWQRTLQGLRGTKTILVIAHRLYTIQNADRIFMIEDGNCVDQGTHGELLKRNERYRRNVMEQVLT